MTFTRRRFIQATGAGAAALGMPTVARSQTGPIRVGLMTVKTGPLASGGIDMERALVQYLKERNYTMAGRKVELFVGDSGGVPAQSRTKLQELVERDKIQIMIGPLDTASALASDDYIRSAQLLTLSVAAAEDMTQRKPRSEEHTSELQSQSNLVCRLLLEKKKATKRDNIYYYDT